MKDNPLYNKIGIDGKTTTKYTMGDWSKIVVHSDKEIKGFFGPYRWMSNFHSCEVFYDGRFYPSSENAYQAAKVVEYDRNKFERCTPAESKKIWKQCDRIDKSSEEWDLRKYEVMANILYDKFYRNLDLRKLLVDTDLKYLEELNWWKDSYWGVDVVLGGKNNLGTLLMLTRRYFSALDGFKR